ncbi:MAG: hypothetical protein PHC51_01620 [bacterium]|nr:hypothetical protein [bacterium]
MSRVTVNVILFAIGFFAAAVSLAPVSAWLGLEVLVSDSMLMIPGLDANEGEEDTVNPAVFWDASLANNAFERSLLERRDAESLAKQQNTGRARLEDQSTEATPLSTANTTKTTEADLIAKKQEEIRLAEIELARLIDSDPVVKQETETHRPPQAELPPLEVTQPESTTSQVLKRQVGPSLMVDKRADRQSPSGNVATSPVRGAAAIVAAIRGDEGADLSLIASFNLQKLPAYKDKVLPLIRKEALASLIERFQTDEWTSTDGLIPGSPAYRFVNRITSVNPELGRSLRVAAVMFQRLYARVIGRGRPFYTDTEFLAYIREVQASRSSWVTARDVIDIGHDHVFVRFFERLKSEFVAELGRQHPQAFIPVLTAYASVDPMHTTSFSRVTLIEILSRLSLTEDAAQRIRVGAFERRYGVLRQFALASASVRRAAANFYLVTAVDAAKKNDLDLSGWIFSQSLLYAPGMPKQRIVGEYLAGAGVYLEGLKIDGENLLTSKKEDFYPPGKAKTAENEHFYLDGTETSDEDEVESSWLGGYSWLLLLVAGSLVIVVFLKRNSSIEPEEYPATGLSQRVRRKSGLMHALKVRYRLLRKLIAKARAGSGEQISVYHRDL